MKSVPNNFVDDSALRDSPKQFKLRRQLGAFYGTCLVVNLMVGSGIFAVPTGVLKYCNGEVITSLIVWATGGAISLLCALCLAELGSTIRESGSWMSFTYYTFGNLPSFLYAWLALTMAYPEGQAAQIAVLGEYILKMFVDEQCPLFYQEACQKLVGISVFMILVMINVRNVKFAIRIQAFCALAKTVALVSIVVVGIVFVIKDSSHLQRSLSSTSLAGFSPGSLGVSGFSLALYQSLWAYNGYEAATWVTEEVKNPSRSIPIILWCAVPLVVALYLCVNVAFLAVLTPNELLSSRAVAVTFGQRIHPAMGYFMMISVCCSIIGSLNTSLIVSGRLPFVAGRLGHMPEFLSMAHVKYVSPLPALMLIATLALLMVSSNSFEILVVAKQFTEWGFKGLSFAGILYLRRTRPDLHRPYKAFTPVVVLAVLICLFMVVIPLVFEPKPLYLLSVGLLGVFAGIYYLSKKKILQMSGIGSVGIFVQKLLLVIPTSKEDIGLK